MITLYSMRPSDQNRAAHLRSALRRVVLLRETGPKSAAWHRARVQTIWRLHAQIEREQASEPLSDPRADYKEQIDE